MVVPYITEALVNRVLPQRDMGLLLQLCAALIFMTVIRSLMMYKRGMLIEDISQSVYMIFAPGCMSICRNFRMVFMIPTISARS